jgi:hypothetical protein
MGGLGEERPGTRAFSSRLFLLLFSSAPTLLMVRLTAAFSHASASSGDPSLFPAPPGCVWLASLPGGNGEGGPCAANSVGGCGPGEDFVSTHSLACSPPAGVAVRPELLVFTPGAGPANYSLFLSTAAGWGFRALAINFNNIGAPNSRCDGGPGHHGYAGKNQTEAYANCMFDVEEERLFGIEHANSSMLWYHEQNFRAGCKQSAACPDCPKECSPFQTVSQKESIVQRTADALTALAQQQQQHQTNTVNGTGTGTGTGSAWSDYLLPSPDRFGNRVRWNETIIAGHSRGSAYPLHIGYYWRPRRLVFFCGLEDYQGARGSGTIRKPENRWEGQVGLSTPAPWVEGYRERAKRLGLVPPSDMFGLGPFGGSCCENWQATWSARACSPSLHPPSTTHIHDHPPTHPLSALCSPRSLLTAL